MYMTWHINKSNILKGKNPTPFSPEIIKMNLEITKID